MTESNEQFNPDPWLRPNIRSLTPYHAARDDYHDGILLDANENSYGPAIPTSLPLHRYPDTRLNDLRQKWAEFRGISLEQVFVGVGSDEAIDLLMRVFCEPGKDEIIITPPTYGMYKVAARINNVGVTEAALSPSFELDARTVLSRVSQHTKLIMLCSPNNPTANVLSLAQMEIILSGFKRLVVVDEAYVDFSESGSLCRLMDRYPNLVILQTLSKSFGMAAIRMGAALAHPKVIGWMMKVKAPYNVNRLTADAALQAFRHVDNMQKKVRQIISERSRLAGALEGHPDVLKIHPSEANFLLVRFRNALAWYQKLAARGVIVRYRGDQLHCENTLRITVGTPAENDLLLKELYDSPTGQTGHAANLAADHPAAQTGHAANLATDHPTGQTGHAANLAADHPAAQTGHAAGQAGGQRTATHHRKTGETNISVSINLDGSGKSKISTGLPFFDHMLDQISRHGYMDLQITCRGDLEIDEHHTIEDTAITLGEAIGAALGDKRGIGRYGFMIAMDESRSMAAIDLSGRPWCVFEGTFRREKVGDFPTEMTSHFFHSLAMALKATLHISVTGDNDHHKIEACFKALARCLRQAVDRNEQYIDILPSSKGLL